MASLCFRCDVELVAAAKFCHRCGTPNLSGDQGAGTEGSTAGDRARIKQDVIGAAKTPTTTRMASTLILPQGPKPLTTPLPARPPLSTRILRARLWRRPTFWILVGIVLGVATILMVVEDLQTRTGQQAEFNRIVTRLVAACPKDSRPQIQAYIAKIQADSGGGDTTMESAVLFDRVVRSVRIPDGDCSKVAEALARPDRFERMVR